MYLKVDGKDCWVVAPTEQELKALRQIDKYDRRMSGLMLPLVTLAFILCMFIVMIFSDVILGSMLIGCLIVAPFLFIAWLGFFGLFRFSPRKTYWLMKDNCRIIPLWTSPVGMALRDHVLFADAWNFRLAAQEEVLRAYSDNDPSALDAFLSDPDNYHVLSKLIAVSRPSAAYDLYQATLWRRAKLVFDALRPFAEPLAADEAAAVAEREQKANQAIHEAQLRQLVEAQVFSMLES